MSGPVIAFVPAFNEEYNIGAVLKTLGTAREQGIIDRIVVVDDGSKDDTLKIASKYDVELISHDGNKGKSQAFKSAVDHVAKDLPPDSDAIFFTTDADMDFTPQHVSSLLEPIRSNPHINMVRTRYRQETPSHILGYDCDYEFSGFRAIRVRALKPLISGNNRWLQALSTGSMVLEEALEELIPKKRDIMSMPDTGGEQVSAGPLGKAFAAAGSDAAATILDGAKIMGQGSGWEIRDDAGNLVGDMTRMDKEHMLVTVGQDKLNIAYNKMEDPERNGRELFQLSEITVLDVIDPGISSRLPGSGATSSREIQGDLADFRKMLKARENVATAIKQLRKVPSENYDRAVTDFMLELRGDHNEENPLSFQKAEIEYIEGLLKKQGERLRDKSPRKNA
ncbi:glycosyltransferase family 2 protein [Candidatus Altiarchaeota archaeon]